MAQTKSLGYISEHPTKIWNFLWFRWHRSLCTFSRVVSLPDDSQNTRRSTDGNFLSEGRLPKSKEHLVDLYFVSLCHCVIVYKL